LIMLL
jgi:hypothetical protein